MTGVLLVSMGIALAGALLAVSISNILHAVFALGISLIGMAGVFFGLGSPFVAAMQILIYVGGIMIAMVFAVMLSQSIAAKPQKERRFARRTGAVSAGALFAAVALAIGRADLPIVSSEAVVEWSVPDIGRALLQHYNLAFETLSLVLLIAIMGAISIARHEPDIVPAAEQEKAK